jgi:hypothetical protein
MSELNRLPILAAPSEPGRPSVGITFDKMYLGDGRQSFYILQSERHRALYHTVNQQSMFLWIYVWEWASVMINREVKAGRRDDSRLIL